MLKYIQNKNIFQIVKLYIVADKREDFTPPPKKNQQLPLALQYSLVCIYTLYVCVLFV